MLKKLVISSLLLSNIFSIAQENNVEPLLKDLTIEIDIKKRIDIYNQLANNYLRILPDSGIYYAQKAIEDSKVIEYDDGLAMAYFRMGNLWRVKADYQLSMQYLDSALAYYAEVNDQKSIGNVYNSKGILHTIKGEYFDALRFYQLSYRNRVEIRDSAGMSGNLNNMALVYRHVGDYERSYKQFIQALQISNLIGNELSASRMYNNLVDLNLKIPNLEKAIEYGEKAEKIKLKYDDYLGLAELYRNLGLVYKLKGDDQKALLYFSKSMDNNLKVNDKKNLAETYTEMGILHQDQGELKVAQEYFEKALDIHQEIGFRRGELKALLQIGKNYFLERKIDETIKSAKEVYDLALKNNLKEHVKDAAALLAKAYEANGQIDNALKFTRLENLYADSLISANNIIQMQLMDQRLKMDSMVLVQQMADSSSDYEDNLRESEVEESTSLKIYLFGLVALLVIAFLIRYYLRKSTK